MNVFGQNLISWNSLIWKPYFYLPAIRNAFFFQHNFISWTCKLQWYNILISICNSIKNKLYVYYIYCSKEIVKNPVCYSLLDTNNMKNLPWLRVHAYCVSSIIVSAIFYIWEMKSSMPFMCIISSYAHNEIGHSEKKHKNLESAIS